MKQRLLLFDSLAHPTLEKTWLGNFQENSFESLVADLKANGFAAACAVGLSGKDGYEHSSFLASCSRFPQLIPIAGYTPKEPIAPLVSMGFCGIKIHPRFSGLDPERDFDLFVSCFIEAAAANLPIFFCTYWHCCVERYPSVDPLYVVAKLLKAVPQARVILVHGGDVSLLRYAELIRFHPNCLLDLSLTLCKYAGSSIDADIRFLFTSFDRRICIGSDHPEYKHSLIRERFEHFSQNLSEEKKHNIAYRNLSRFLHGPSFHRFEHLFSNTQPILE